MLFILFLELFLTVGYILFSRKLFILQNPIICMITGRSGRKEVAHVENLYSSRRISTATLKRRGISVLNSAKKSGLLTFNANNNESFSEFIMDNTDNNGVDVAFECSGTKSSVKACLESIGIKGKLIQVGLPKELVETDYRNMVYREQEIIGIRVYREGTFMRAIQFLSEKNILLKDLVSDVFKLENIMEAFEQANDKNNSLKVLIELQPF